MYIHMYITSKNFQTDGEASDAQIQASTVEGPLYLCFYYSQSIQLTKLKKQYHLNVIQSL